jgi:amino acid transporter
MVTIYNPSYQQQNWQQSLVMVAIGMFATLMNTYGAKKLPLLEHIMLVVQVGGFVCIITTLWVFSPMAPASEVFTSFSNFGGWPDIGTACFVGSITATASFAGSDAAVHMAEETEDASRAVPRMIMLTIAVNGLMAFIFIITYVSVLSGWTSQSHMWWYLMLGREKMLRESAQYTAMIGMRLNLADDVSVLLHHRHRSGDRLGVAVSVHRCEFLRMLEFRSPGWHNVLSAGVPRINREQRRHSLHDDDPTHPEHLRMSQCTRRRFSPGLGTRPRPSPTLFALVPQGKLCGSLRLLVVLLTSLQIAVIGTPVPINSILFSLSVLVIIALINIGSTAALNTIVALLTGATSFSYALSIACILFKRLRGEPLPPARFSLGKFGLAINAFATCYVVVSATASFFPVTVPTDAANMNWSSAMFGGVLVIACVDYLVRGRKHYIEPRKHLNKVW